MRFSAEALVPGWLKRTSLALPMLKLFQSMMARCEAWSICSSEPAPCATGLRTTAWPLTTPRSTGSVFAGSTVPAACAHAAGDAATAPSASSTATLHSGAAIGRRRVGFFFIADLGVGGVRT